MDRPALRRIVLELAGSTGRPDLARLAAGDWAEIDRIADQHRLQPLLHARHRGNRSVPAKLAAGWEAAHRLQTMLAMVQRAELAETCVVLERAGYLPVALKGAWLASHAYPDPALRPLRDIDLLVRPDQVIPAFEALLAAGYRQAGPAEMPLADIVRLDKHMPPLVAPRGTTIELHHRLWEHEGRLDHGSPQSDEAGLRARAAIGPDGVRYPAPQDLLVHLIVHAVYSHRLDCGPLILTDIDYLLRRAAIDWTGFWTAAAAQGWRDGARLLLELTARYCPNPAIDLAADQGGPTPTALLAAAPDLLLQELETRASAGLAAATLKAGPAKLVERMLGRRKIRGQAAVTRHMTDAGGVIGWAGSRALRSLRDLSRGDVRRQSRQLAALSRWLDR